MNILHDFCEKYDLYDYQIINDHVALLHRKYILAIIDIEKFTNNPVEIFKMAIDRVKNLGLINVVSFLEAYLRYLDEEDIKEKIEKLNAMLPYNTVAKLQGEEYVSISKPGLTVNLSIYLLDNLDVMVEAYQLIERGNNRDKRNSSRSDQ